MTTDAVTALMRGSDWVTFVDQNIIPVFVTDDSRWRRWPQFSLDRAVLTGPLTINDIV
jgi:hypothetical protein